MAKTKTGPYTAETLIRAEFRLNGIADRLAAVAAAMADLKIRQITAGYAEVYEDMLNTLERFAQDVERGLTNEKVARRLSSLPASAGTVPTFSPNKPDQAPPNPKGKARRTV